MDAIQVAPIVIEWVGEAEDSPAYAMEMLLERPENQEDFDIIQQLWSDQQTTEEPCNQP